MSKSRGQRIWDRLRDKRDTEHVSIWRGRLQYRAYLETEGQPTYIRRARAFEMLMDKLPIYIDDEQLLAGDTCTEPMSLEWFPELTCGWLKNYLDSGSATYSFGDISMEEMREIAEYWAKNSAKDSFVEYMGDSWKKWVADTSEFGAWLLGSDGGVQSQRGWNVLDFEKALRLGYRGIVEEIDQAMARLKGYTNERLVKEQFYSAIKRELLAAIRFSNRYADLAEKMAESAPEGRREELLELARICRKVPEYPAGSFHEAVQNMWFTYLMVYWETLAAGVSLGRVDQYLYPYYKADIEAGVLDREKALEILECLRVKFSCRRDFADTTIRRMVSGWTQFANCTLGGQHGDGSDAVNELSFLWLDAAERTRIPHPTLSVRYHKNMNRDFALRAIEVCSLGMGFPAFFGDASSIRYLESKGVTHEDAMNYALAGCVLTVVPGKYAPTWPLIVNMAKVLEMTLYNGIDPVSGKKLGIETGNFEDFSSYGELWEAYKLQCKAVIEKAAEYLNYARIYRVEKLPDLFSSIFLDDCIAKGRPSFADSVRYHKISSMYTLPVGVIEVADSLAAIKYCVYDKKTVTPAQLMEALKNDFKGYEDIQIELLSAPKFGNDDEYVDDIAAEIYDWLCETGQQIEGPYGSRYECAPHNLSFHGPMGENTGALPNGRNAGKSLVDGAVSPCHGMDKNGPTAVLASAGKIHHDRIFGTLLNMKFLPSSLKTQSDREKLLALIQTYFEDYGGKHVQFNVVDRAKLLDAKAHPEKYRNLIVRVAGYSAFWVELSEAIQDDIIQRTEHQLY